VENDRVTCLCTAPPASEKTVGTHLVLDRVCEDAEGVDGVDVTAVQMECRDLNTSYQVAVSLVNVLRESTPRSSLPTTGYPEGDVFDMLFDELRDADTSHVLIALDEIDNIGTSDNVLYKLGRCNNRNSAKFVDPDNTKVGLVGITNDSTFRDSLDPRVKSTLCEHTRFTSRRMTRTNSERFSKTEPPTRFTMAS